MCRIPGEAGKDLMRSEEGKDDNPIDIALKNFERITTYRVTLRSKSGRSAEVIRYYFKSGHVRMEFISPFRGAVLIYNPTKNEVLLKPLRITNRVVALSPENKLIRSAAGHGVARSDIGSLLKVAEELRSGGTTDIFGTEIIAGRRALCVRVTGSEHAAVSGIHEYTFWLDEETCLPLKVVAYDLSGTCREEVLMDDLETNIDLPDELFSLP
jgi:outer membrane lipoprotein-sorting protein